MIVSDRTRARFWAKVECSDGCWNWTGAANGDYGVFWFEGHNVGAYRFAWEIMVGPIPNGLTIDHLCCNPRCVNPAHLEVVTQGENTRRGKRRITQCPYGHPYDATNTYWHPNTGARQCKTCRNERNRKYIALAKASAAA